MASRVNTQFVIDDKKTQNFVAAGEQREKVREEDTFGGPRPSGVVRVDSPLQVLCTPHKPKQMTVLGTQVGGSHYTDCKIQPIEYIWANNLGFSEGNIIKYVTRWRAKGGIKDLEKAKHHIALLIEHAQKEGLK